MRLWGCSKTNFSFEHLLFLCPKLADGAILRRNVWEKAIAPPFPKRLTVWELTLPSGLWSVCCGTYRDCTEKAPFWPNSGFCVRSGDTVGPALRSRRRLPPGSTGSFEGAPRGYCSDSPALPGIWLWALGSYGPSGSLRPSYIARHADSPILHSLWKKPGLSRTFYYVKQTRCVVCCRHKKGRGDTNWLWKQGSLRFDSSKR